MDLKLKEVEQVINSELTSKIKKTSIIFNELLIETNVDDLIEVIIFTFYIVICMLNLFKTGFI